MRNLAIIFIIVASCTSTSELSSGPFNIEQTNAWRSYDTSRFLSIQVNLELDRDTLRQGEPLTGKVNLLQDEMFREIARELKLNYRKTYSQSTYDELLIEALKIGENVDTLNFEVYPKKPRQADTTTREYFLISIHLSNRTHSYDSTFARSELVYWKSNGY